MNLYHFSENPDIRIFHPLKLESRPDEPAMVWAIDEFHAPHYFFPRECPRVCVWSKDDTTEQDRLRYFGHSAANRMMAIESGWLDRVRTTRLYRYVFETDAFQLYEANAGYYTSIRTVEPVKVECMDDLLGSIIRTGIEFRMTPSLMPLRAAILESMVNFSMIRLRNVLQDGEGGGK